MADEQEWLRGPMGRAGPRIVLGTGPGRGPGRATATGNPALMEELTQEKTPRARFLRRTQIARVMVDSRPGSIAVPILLELLVLIDNHKLADWEGGDLVAEPMALLYRCMEKLPELTAGDHSRDTLYPRICSLDPLQAMALTVK